MNLLREAHKNLTTTDVIATFFAIIAVRIGVDFVLHGIDAFTARSFFLMVVHTVSFFGLSYICLTVFFAFIARITLRQAAFLVLWSFFLIFLPPIFDALIAHFLLDGVAFWSYYIFDTPQGLLVRYFTFFGSEPTNGITYGTRILTGLATAFFAALTYFFTRSPWRTVASAIGTYTILFILGVFPSLVAYAALMFEQPLSTIDDVTIAGFFLAPTLAFSGTAASFAGILNLKLSVIYVVLLVGLIPLAYIPEKAATVRAFITNTRLPQIVYHIGLLFTGFMLAATFSDVSAAPSAFTLVAIIALAVTVAIAWVSAVCFNDITDQEIDKLSNTDRPLISGLMRVQDFTLIGTLLMITSFVIIFLIAPHAAIFLAAYYGFSWVYSMPPLRLKRFPLIATFIAACASLSIVLLGFVILAHDQTFNDFPVAIGITLLGVLTFVLPIKDLKDIEGDGRERVRTIPVLIGEKKARLVLGVILFASYIVTVLFFHQVPIFVAALACGSISFWVLTSRRGSTFAFNARSLHSTILLICTIFVAIFVQTLFL